MPTVTFQCNIDLEKLSKQIGQQLEEVTDLLVLRFKEIGEECFKIAKEKKAENGGYNDVTGNLRSSIGYVILVDGETVFDGKPEQSPGSQGDGAKGVAEGEALLNTLKSKFPSGVVLIVCAGMEYASYVEDIHGLDVLASARNVAERMMKQLEAQFRNH